MRNAISISLLLFALGAAASAQTFPIHFEVTGTSSPTPGMLTLSDPRSTPDVDGDGVRDLVVREGNLHWNVLSGASGSFLHAIPTGIAVGEEERFFREVGDLDGDGASDFISIKGIHPLDTTMRRADLWSGASGTLIWSISLGDSLALAPVPGLLQGSAVGIGDQNADGVRDLVFLVDLHDSLSGASFNTMEIRSGVDGALIHGIPSSAYHANAVAVVGDVTGDGIEDFVASADDSPWAAPAAGGAGLLAGGSFQYLAFWNGAVPNQRFGNGCACAGDLNADGVADVYISSLRSETGPLGYVAAFSGADGSLLWREDHTSVSGAVENWRIRRDTSRDWDGDGVSDVVIESLSPVNPSPARVLSGLNGAELAQIPPGSAVVGDLNGDLIPDLVEPVANSSGTWTLRATVHKGVAGYGAGSGALSVGWAPNLFAPATGQVQVSGGGPGNGGALVGSLFPQNSTVGPLTAPLLIDTNHIVFWVDIHFNFAGGYEAFASLSAPWLAGVIVYYQVVEYATGETSNAFELMFGN